MKLLYLLLLLLCLAGCTQRKVTVWLSEADSDVFIDKAVPKWLQDGSTREIADGFLTYDPRIQAFTIDIPRGARGQVIIEYSEHLPEVVIVQDNVVELKAHVELQKVKNFP